MVTIGGQGVQKRNHEDCTPNPAPWARMVLVGIALVIGMSVEVCGFVHGSNGLRSQVNLQSLKMRGNVGLHMSLNPELSKRFPRDFKKVRGYVIHAGVFWSWLSCLCSI